MDILRDDKLVIYTSIFGGGYSLPDTFQAESVRYLCFTDQDQLSPNGWEIVRLAPIFKDDLVRSAREPKIRPHRYLAEFKRSIYIDPSVKLIADPNNLWNFLMGEKDSSVFGALYHSFRSSVLQEFEVVYREKLDSTQLLEEHLTSYVRTNPSALELKPIWGGMISRRHMDQACIDVMERWFCQVMRYSRRDQLSLPAMLDKVPEHLINLQLADNHSTNYHYWPVPGYARPSRYSFYVTDNIIPAILRAEKMVAENRNLIADLDTIRADRDTIRADRDTIIRSRSWRLMSWYRYLGKVYKKFVSRFKVSN